MAPPNLVPALVDDVVEEILLLCPPDDPARLVRAALVCKGWRRLLSGPRFRCRFRELHRAAPLLGFLYSRSPPSLFESATSFCLHLRLCPSNADPRVWRAIDACHGRILVSPLSLAPRKESLFIWCPVTGDLRVLPMPQFEYYWYWTAALLCTAAGCDHLDCDCGPFLVVFVGTDKSEQHTYVCVYSSEASAWSELTSVLPDIGACIDTRPNALVGNAVYFMLKRASGILKHDLITRELSVIKVPPAAAFKWFMVLTTEEGGLGLATITDGFKLLLWSMEAGSNAGWVQSRVFELKNLLPAEALFTLPQVVGFAEGVGVVLVRTSGGFFFTVDIKSGCVKKIGKGFSHSYVLPYVNFCTPVLRTASSGAGPRAGASTVSQTDSAHVLPS